MPFAILTLLSALSLAAVAGWFSIVGFMAIYAGAPMYALIMGVVTECAKLVTTSWLYRNWEYADWKLKAPLLYFTIALMVATSIGVFGFLSKAHIEQGADKIDNSAKIESLNYQINREKSIIADNEKVIAQLDATVNSLLGKDRADRALAVRKSQMSQRKQLQDDSSAAQKRIDDLSKEKFALESEVRKLQLEVGPIRYIAELIYGVQENANKNIEAAVRIFTLLLVSTLDPLAVILLIAANHTLIRLRREKEEKKGKETAIDVDSDVTRARQATTEEVRSQAIKPNIEDGPSPEKIHEASISKEESTVSKTIFPEIVEPVNEVKEELVTTSTEVMQEVAPSSLPNENVEIRKEALEGASIKEEQRSEIVSSSETSTTPEEAEIQSQIPQSLIDEIKSTTLAKLLSARVHTPVAVVRSPSITKVSQQEVSDESEPEAELPLSAVEEEIQEESKDRVEPWAQQEPVLRELLGSAPHFIPAKINEEIESRKVEMAPSTKEMGAEATSAGGKEETNTQKIHTETSSANKKAEDDTSKDTIGIVQGIASAADKYPKALSWINEFRGE